MAEAGHWLGRRVLLTGATGFIGNALVDRLLALGADVSAVIRTTDYSRPYFFGPSWKMHAVRVVTGDIRDFQTAQRAIVQCEPQTVFHLAAVTQVVEARGMPLETFQTNVMGTVNMLEAIRQSTFAADLPAPDVIVASSDKVYGRPLTIPATENTPFNPYHPYDASKAAADLTALSYARHYGMSIAISRMANVYGPGDTNWRRIVPGTIRSILQGTPIVLRSDGQQVRDYLFIDDAVEAYLLLAERMRTTPGEGWQGQGPAQGRPFNFPGLPFKVLDLVALISLAMQYNGAPIIKIIADDETPVLELATIDAMDVVGNYLRTSMVDGITRTIDWMLMTYHKSLATRWKVEVI